MKDLIIYLVMLTRIGLNLSDETGRVRLTDVQTITLRKGEWSKSRRVTPVLQLKCIGGSAGCSYQPETVQCYNRGVDGTNVQWECKAELPASLNFGYMKVSCEGFENSRDSFILQGSCGLEYKLESFDSSNGISVETFISFLVIVTLIGLCVIRATTDKTSDAMILPTSSTNHVFINNYSNRRSYSIPSFKVSSGFAFTSNR